MLIQRSNTDPSPNTIIGGKYKLLENIGEGGIGSVWVAVQPYLVKRKVAIKLIKPGVDSKQVLARSEAERQALAVMDHPNIGKVFDGGLTEQGRPYFVMEYVKIVPFTDYCDRAKLPLNDRLKLFFAVCSAVQQAHHKGIVHRDLKPLNILICFYDGNPVPKVIDFGLAKALHQPLTEASIFTGHAVRSARRFTRAPNKPSTTTSTSTPAPISIRSAWCCNNSSPAPLRSNANNSKTLLSTRCSASLKRSNHPAPAPASAAMPLSPASPPNAASTPNNSAAPSPAASTGSPGKPSKKNAAAAPKLRTDSRETSSVSLTKNPLKPAPRARRTASRNSSNATKPKQQRPLW